MRCPHGGWGSGTPGCPSRYRPPACLGPQHGGCGIDVGVPVSSHRPSGPAGFAPVRGWGWGCLAHLTGVEHRAANAGLKCSSFFPSVGRVCYPVSTGRWHCCDEALGFSSPPLETGGLVFVWLTLACRSGFRGRVPVFRPRPCRAAIRRASPPPLREAAPGPSPGSVRPLRGPAGR